MDLFRKIPSPTLFFVHGLQGHPLRTWQSKSCAEISKPPKKRARLDFLGFGREKSESDADNTLFWPSEILALHHSDIRILTYGYDSNMTMGPMTPTSKNGIFQHAHSLLRALDRIRGDCPKRPIIFFAHSLGGLVIKQVLVEARKQISDVSLVDIYNSTYATIFFGTPHRGSEIATWGLLLSNIANALTIDTKNAILRDLDPSSGSTKLEESILDFDDILRDQDRMKRLKDLKVFSFQEEQGMTSVKGLGGKVRFQRKL